MNILKIFKNRKVLITGHTGFKGSWLSLWLSKLGANILGLSFDIPTEPSHFKLTNPVLNHVIADIRNPKEIQNIIINFEPEIVFHMAAQSLVRSSYENPVETFETNIMGTIHVLESLRHIKSKVKSVIVVTSDKCYENKEKYHAYKESDPLGGYDPYSASKACTEIVTSSYQRSFFPVAEYGNSHQCLIASVRAGNVIGGGDWSDFRLLPDVYRAYARGEVLVIKSPKSIRPWQHVLEPLRGYMMLAGKLLKGETQYIGAWNFGPNQESCIQVDEVLSKIQLYLPKLKYRVELNNVHEAQLLMLDSQKAKTILGWKPILNIDNAIELTSNWYQKYYDENMILSHNQIADYELQIN
ncbi:MAG: CDP-glucose 4,6-dehydratase [Bdellovibrionaceae bacterium]|nr:CDP-glucose 4,6-dehydratase [Pseudobdellovibrionaceae bacterium]